jgi:hypothetical protein
MGKAASEVELQVSYHGSGRYTLMRSTDGGSSRIMRRQVSYLGIKTKQNFTAHSRMRSFVLLAMGTGLFSKIDRGASWLMLLSECTRHAK